MRLERGDPLLSDVVLCLNTGWTPEELDKMPERFVEIATIYLNALHRKQKSERDQVRVGQGFYP